MHKISDAIERVSSTLIIITALDFVCLINNLVLALNNNRPYNWVMFGVYIVLLMNCVITIYRQVKEGADNDGRQ